MDSTRQQHLRTMPFRNAFTETVPAFGCMEIADEEIRNGQRVWLCRQPGAGASHYAPQRAWWNLDGNPLDIVGNQYFTPQGIAFQYRYVFNGPTPVPPGQYGECHCHLPARGVVNLAGRQVFLPGDHVRDIGALAGIPVGPAKGSWELFVNAGPYVVQSADQTEAVLDMKRDQPRYVDRMTVWVGQLLRRYQWHMLGGNHDPTWLSPIGVPMLQVIYPFGLVVINDVPFGPFQTNFSTAPVAPMRAYYEGVVSLTCFVADSVPADFNGWMRFALFVSQGHGPSQIQGDVVQYGIAYDFSGERYGQKHQRLPGSRAVYSENICFPFILPLNAGNVVGVVNLSNVEVSVNAFTFQMSLISGT